MLMDFLKDQNRRHPNGMDSAVTGGLSLELVRPCAWDSESLLS